MSRLGVLINGGSGIVSRDILKDISKPITNTDYFDIVITDLKPNTSYNVQFAWVYPDDTRSDYSATYTFTTSLESAPAIPSTPSVSAGPGLINVTWNGNKASGGALTNYAKVNVYVNGVLKDFFLSAGTKSIALAKGTYSITLKSASTTDVISDSSTAASATITADATDAATALTTAQQAALDAGIAQSTANGKNKVTYSTNSPGSTANTIGDIWYQYGTSGPNNGRIIAQYSGAGGTSWTQTTISGLVVANLDAGSITTGTLAVGISITGSNGSFSLDAVTGNISSNTGTIGGWTIGPDGFSSSSIELKSQNYTSGATTGALKLKSNFEEYAVYAADGDFGIKDMGNFIDVLFYNVDLNRVFVGSSTTTVKAGKSYSLNASGLRNIYASSTAGDPSIASPVEGDIKLEW